MSSPPSCAEGTCAHHLLQGRVPVIYLQLQRLSPQPRMLQSLLNNAFQFHETFPLSLFRILHCTMAQDLIQLRSLDLAATKEGDQQPQVLNCNAESQVPNSEFSLPPVDTGKEAWLFLAACWGVEAVTFGQSTPRRAVPLLKCHRFRLLLWGFPGFLQCARTVCGLRQYCCYWHHYHGES